MIGVYKGSMRGEKLRVGTGNISRLLKRPRDSRQVDQIKKLKTFEKEIRVGILRNTNFEKQIRSILLARSEFEIERGDGELYEPSFSSFGEFKNSRDTNLLER